MRMQIRTTAALLMLACVVLVIPSIATAQDDAAGQAARVAAEAWLASMAAGEYQVSWKEAGEMFRAAMTAEAWAAQAAAGHQQIGDVVGRDLAELRAVTDPPGVPPGDYVHLRYSSRFSVIGDASEVVVLTREAERGWRVIGYFVQPPTEG